MLYRRLLLTALAGAALQPLAANAAIYCVNSASGLNAAIASANSANENTIQDVRVRPGLYALPSGINFNPGTGKEGKSFSLTGGWNSDCSGQTINADDTVLNGAAGGNFANFIFGGDNTSYTIEGVSIINFGGFSLSDPSCDFGCPDTQFIRVRYNQFRQGLALGISTEDADSLTVSNNLFADISSTSSVNGNPIKLYYYNNESPPNFSFNTLANIGCGGPDFPALDILTQTGGATFHHNILQTTCASDWEFDSLLSGQPVALRNNLYATRSGLAPTANVGNIISTDPGFVNTAGVYSLRETPPVSAAINAGMTPVLATQLGLLGSFPTQDLDGPAGTRLIGNQYDIGAYESSVNNATVITVTSNADAGAGSLRAAITAANTSPGLQKIEFNIPGGCNPTPQFIFLQSPLPDIQDSVEIDGYSQPGSAANTLETGSDAVFCIVILSQSAVLNQAMQVPTAASAGTSFSVKGLAFAGTTGFNGNFGVAVRLRGGSNHVVQGNAFAGIGPGSLGSLGSLSAAIQIVDNAQNVLVGGSANAHRNSFGASSGIAIFLNSSSGGHTIQNNYIGLSASGLNASQIDVSGIVSASPGVRILDNVIAAIPNNAAILITGASATGNITQGNRLGVNVLNIPNAALRNGTGIQITAGSNHHFIGSLLGSLPSNLITNSNDAGIWITPTAGSNNLVRPNQIFGNGISGLGLGIDIGPLGQSTNDLLDQDSGPNNGQNWPSVVSSLPNANGTRQVSIELNSNPNTNFRIDVYRSPDCPAGNRGGNMLNRVGTVSTSSNASGDATPSFTISGTGAPGKLTAVATNLFTNDSSEPGLCYTEVTTIDLLMQDGFE